MSVPALDPAVSALIDELPRGVPAHLDLDEERAYQLALSDLIFFRNTLPGPLVHAADEHSVPVAGGVIRVRVYRPRAQGVLPGHVSFHGGGWKLGSIDERVNDALYRQRAVEAGCVVVAVEYRLAPEHKYPIPLQDCYAALCWTVDNADLFGIDPGNVSIGGVSAGGNLAAAVALHARNSGGPLIRFQLLEVPTLDLTRGLARETREAGVLPANAPQPTMEDAIDVYLRSPGEASEALASPLAEPDLRGLPPAFVMTAEHDMLRTEGELYADRLNEAGVPCASRRYAGALHGTSTWTRVWQPAARWQQDAVQALAAAHASQPMPLA